LPIPGNPEQREHERLVVRNRHGVVWRSRVARLRCCLTGSRATACDPTHECHLSRPPPPSRVAVSARYAKSTSPLMLSDYSDLNCAQGTGAQGGGVRTSPQGNFAA